VCWGMTFDNG